jgi:hypothetical protein
MNVKLAAILPVMLISMTGCFDKGNAPTQNPVKTPAPAATQKGPQDSVPVAFTSEDIVKLLKSQGLELLPAKGGPTFNGVAPTYFTVHHPKEEVTSRIEYVGIYIYRDVKERQKGYAELESLEKRADMINSTTWENTNALVIYWHPRVEPGKKTAFEDDITKALSSWEIKNPAPVATQNGPGPVATNFTSDDVVNLLKTQGLPLTKVNYMAEAFPLNNVNPEIFSFVDCDKTLDCKPPNEYLYLYVFNSQKDRVKSIDDLNEQMKNQSGKPPVVFARQNKNAIVLLVGISSPELQSKIETALQGWDSPWEVPAK